MSDSSTNPEHTICSCPICTCTCDASFRRDQLQSIHTAKQFESWEKRNKKTDVTEASVEHTVIKDITAVIRSHAKDAIIEVLQRTSPIKSKIMPGMSAAGHGQIGIGNDFDSRELQLAIERSLGITALSMHKDVGIAGNIALKYALREEMGGVPSTRLVAGQESVCQHRQRVGKESEARCSRASRNDLVDLSILDENEEIQEENVIETSMEDRIKMKKRIMIKLLSMFKDENDSLKKNKIRYAMKALNDYNAEVKNETIDFTFQVYSTDLESFDSMDAALNILDFAENESK